MYIHFFLSITTFHFVTILLHQKNITEDMFPLKDKSFDLKSKLHNVSGETSIPLGGMWNTNHRGCVCWRDKNRSRRLQ